MEKLKTFSSREILSCLFIAFAVFSIYGATFHYDFVDCDDNIYVTQNARVKEGLSVNNIIWAFKTTDTANWHPLTWLSLFFNSSLHGIHAAGFHITNILLHLCNSFFLFFILKRMTGALFLSAMVAVLFAVHPLNVESVSWISQRKTVLSTFFFFAAVWAYINYAASLKLINYILVAVMFTAGHMSKAMLVTLPAVLLLIDYWPLKRFSNLKDVKEANNIPVIANSFEKLTWIKLVAEKIPLFALSFIILAVTLYAASAGGAVRSLGEFPLGGRIANAAVSYVEYLYRMIWPFDLAFFYPWRKAVPMWQIILSASIISGITCFALMFAKRRPYILVGWLWYLITMVPVIGIVQVGYQAMADRYAYIPMIGIFVITAWGGYDILSRYLNRQGLIILAALSVIIFFTTISIHQVRHWHNSETLFRRALSVTKDNHMAHQGMGHVYLLKGNNELAAAHLSEALRIRPGYDDARLNLAIVFMKQGLFEDAIVQLQWLVERDKNNVKVLNNLGVALACEGRFKEAAANFQKAISLDPDYPEPRANLEKIKSAMEQEMIKKPQQ